jgi:hypothetical protein
MEPHPNDRAILTFWEEGLDPAEMARSLGISRERVRQKLHRNGLRGKNPNAIPAKERVLEAARQSESLVELAKRLAVSEGLLKRALNRQDMQHEVRALLQARRELAVVAAKVVRQQALSQRVRRIASAVGHTPTGPELVDAGVFPTVLLKAFGSVAQAMECAGLRPNKPGHQPEPLRPGFPTTT